ncbi:MAG TPA: SCO family protein [Kofleriaceae bacterium]|nr:SCO family protein [Kofleriaceae bacterium]
MEKAAHPVPGRRLLFGLLVVFLVAVVPSIVVPTLMCRPEHKALPDLGEVPAFTLTDQTGQPFSDEALRGKVSIVSFIFTRCDTICPVISMKMARIQEKTFDIGRDIKLLSFSVDPNYDTPERLAAYAKKYGADPERWRFVTGPYDKVHSLIEGPFMTSMLRVEDRPSGVPDIQHGGYFLLMDTKMHIRGVYDSDIINQLEALMRDARYLVRTSR